MKTETDPPGDRPSFAVLLRCVLAGVLMGLANLVPGISGGTMLVAAGVYRRFIDAVSEVSRLRFRVGPMMTLAAVVVGAALAIAGGSGVISFVLAGWRWAAYSLFIGLTLGGAPVLWKMMRPATAAALAGLAVGFGAMLAVIFIQGAGASGGGGDPGAVRLVLSGAAAAAAMILPGISGAYLLLLLGVYEAIIDAIKNSVAAVSSLDFAALWDQMGVIIPVGIGVLIGVIGVSNILRIVLHRYEKVTIAFLLGLLLAAPAGLYPFVRGVEPSPGETLGGELVTEDNVGAFEPREWRQERFTPSAGHLAGSAGLIVLGIAATMGIAHLGRDGEA